MALNELFSGIGSRTAGFLQRAAERGIEVRVETKGAVVRDTHALGRRLIILGFAASIGAVGVNATGIADSALAPPKVRVNGDLVQPDPMLARLVHVGGSEREARIEVLQHRDLIQGLAHCSPGLEKIDPALLLTAYRYTAGWQDFSSPERAGDLFQLAQANEKLAGSLSEQGLQLKVRGDYSGWVSAVGSVARGVAEAAGSPQSQAVVRGAASVASSGAYAARGLGRIGDAQGAQRRIDLAGRSISDIARLAKSADRLLAGGPRANGSEKKDGPSARAPRPAERAAGGLSPDARAIGVLSDAAQRMGFHVSLSPLTGEPVPKDHATVIATHNSDFAAARQAAQRNLAEVATLHEYARASGIHLNFDLMYREYAQLADAAHERERQASRHTSTGDRPRGG